ncbi:hypothetical protein QBC32DRAFT_196588, partial [Pseudoneurospora amorphoporcata]
LDVPQLWQMTGGIRMKRDNARCRKGQPQLGDPEREGPECPPPDSSREKLGTELEAPPEFPMVKNFMRSETRHKERWVSDQPRASEKIALRPKEGIPMMVSGGSGPE